MKIYLETTVPNFLFAEDATEKRDATREFWNWLRLGTEQVFTSELVIEELKRTPDPMHRRRLLTALDELEITVLTADARVRGFADLLAACGAVPVRLREDAFPIAIAAVCEMNILASWNLKHIVKLRTMTAVNDLCLTYGLQPPRILTPQAIVP